MKITIDEIKHVADLARLTFSEEELQSFSKQLNDILTYVDKLGELDTAGVEPTFHAIELDTPYKPDEVHQVITKEESLSNAPEREEDFFVVPRVI